MSPIGYALPLPPSEQSLEPYKIFYEDVEKLHCLGQGACGTVYLKKLSDDTNDDKDIKQVAIKVCEAVDEDSRSFVLNEIALLKKIGKQPNLIEYLGSFEAKDYISITTVRIPGKNLFDGYIRYHTFLPLKLIFKIGAQIGSALHTLEGLNIINGGIKASNILFERHSEVATLIDFDGGIDLEKDPSNHHILYPSSMRPPEVVLNVPFKKGSDMSALAMTLYNVYTKKRLLDISERECHETSNDILYSFKELLGPPPKDFIDKSPDRDSFFLPNSTDLKIDEPSSILDPIHKEKFSLIARFAEKHDERKSRVEAFQKILKKMITWDPENRIAPKQLVRMIENLEI